jgi:tetratricopeptide (TPR) repeat protein
MKRLFLILILLFSACRVYYGVWRGDFSEDGALSHAQKADKLKSQGKIVEAIRAYETHIKHRLADSRRRPEENPYFYQLYIGDLYIEQNKPQQAREAYLIAKEKRVETNLIADRLVKLARYLVARGKNAEAIKLLKEQRSVDPDALDAEIDEIHKKTVAAEDMYYR